MPTQNGLPLILVMNHPSWWDVIIGMILSEKFENYRHWAPIASNMLERYGFFKRLGFFGVDASVRGAATFARTACALLKQPFNAVWITAQGEFVDPRCRPVCLKPGAGFLASKLRCGLVLPLAVEYPFWDERTPEVLVRFGVPLDLSLDPASSGSDWTEKITAALTACQDQLALEAMQRDAALFQTILTGSYGVGGIYDRWRSFWSRLRGRHFDAHHADSKKQA